MKTISRSESIVPRSFFEKAKFALERYGVLGTISRFLMMQDEARRFVEDAPLATERRRRRQMLRRFEEIHRRVPCAHSPSQFVVMGRLMLEHSVPGPIIQCGSYKGGSTAKLSLLAHYAGRRLYVCDSFQGLPAPVLTEDSRQVGWGDNPDYVFAQAEYSGTLEEVRDVTRRYGSLASCEFVPGFFADTLTRLDVAPSIVFIDVDYVSSARDCLRHLWPRLVAGGLWFTHEAGLRTYLEGLLDGAWWWDHLGEAPPVLYGAGTGLSPVAASIAYMQKRQA